jgi:hypothetical protein
VPPAPTGYDPAKYKPGTSVRVASRAALEHFLNTYTMHHKLHPDQLAFGGREARVLKTYMYHGGDIIYELEGVPGIWHERCLEAV